MSIFEANGSYQTSFLAFDAKITPANLHIEDGSLQLTTKNTKISEVKVDQIITSQGAALETTLIEKVDTCRKIHLEGDVYLLDCSNIDEVTSTGDLYISRCKNIGAANAGKDLHLLVPPNQQYTLPGSNFCPVDHRILLHHPPSYTSTLRVRVGESYNQGLIVYPSFNKVLVIGTVKKDIVFQAGAAADNQVIVEEGGEFEGSVVNGTLRRAS